MIICIVGLLADKQVLNIVCVLLVRHAELIFSSSVTLCLSLQPEATTEHLTPEFREKTANVNMSMKPSDLLAT